MRKLKKALLIFISTLILFIAVLLILISPLTEFLVERYDVEYTGREITMEDADVNPFTGNIHFDELKVQELKSDSVFFSAAGVSANIAMLKLFSKTYEITEFSLDSPRGMIIKNQKVLNFNDLIGKFSSKDTTGSDKPPVHFNILSIKINNGEFHFHDANVPVNYFIKNVNIESKGKLWDVDSIAAQFSFSSGTGKGNAKGDLAMNVTSMNYSLAVAIQKFDLDIIQQYLKDLTNGARFSANLDADVKATGNFNDGENLTASGIVAINDFHFGKIEGEDYASFTKLVLDVNELSPSGHKYICDSISLDRPYFKYELYDHLDNLQVMFGKDGANIAAAATDPAKFNLVIEIANYVKLLSKNFFESNYKINRVAVYNGSLHFNDYSISEKFAMQLDPLTILADSIDKNRDRVNVSLRTGILPYGDAWVTLSINPKDSGDFDMSFRIADLPGAMFNPYVISQTSYPLDRGTIEADGQWNVRNGEIKSSNHVLVIDPRFTSRLKNKNNKWRPMFLVMPFVRERGNIIEYNVPITGSLKTPKFHLKDVLMHVLENVLVKPVTTPYRVHVKSLETKIERSLTLKWEMRQNTLGPKQERFVRRMAYFLDKNPEATIIISPQDYSIKEKEYILYFEAKKKYYMLTRNRNEETLTSADLSRIDKMSVKDSLFVQYLDNNTEGAKLHTIQEKCYQVVGPSIIDAVYQQLNSKRMAEFLSPFKSREVEGRVRFVKGENIIPYNGFSFYQVEYKGASPESLKSAYRLMEEFNEGAPRKEFKSERLKIGTSM